MRVPTESLTEGREDKQQANSRTTRRTISRMTRYRHIDKGQTDKGQTDY